MAVVGQTRLEFCDAPFALLHVFAGAGQDLALDVELFTRYQIEAAQSLRQHITKVVRQILARLRKSRRDRVRESLRDGVNGLDIDHGSTSKLLRSVWRAQDNHAIGELHQNV
jgi:hypothetical protein